MRRTIILGMLGFLAIATYATATNSQAAVALPTGAGAALAPRATLTVGSAPVADYAWYSHTIMVEDHTGARWSVDRAVSLWNSGTGVTLVSGRCRAHVPCIRVYEGSYGQKVGWEGQTAYDTTRWHWRGDTYTMAGVTVIRFNNSITWATRVQRDDAACHELGHAVGIGPHSKSRSCMYYVADGRWTVPSSADRAGLRLAYRSVR
jgi:hypothetical protein